MNKAILGVSILAIGIGTYFYLSGTEEVKTVKQKVVEVKEKTEVNETVIKNKKVVKKKTDIEVVKGYKLPPKPDKALNNSTLLGIDSNNNMLRDDVERWIVKQPWSHQKIAATLQFARGFEILIRDDMGNNKRKHTLSNMSDSVLKARKRKEAGKIISLEDDIDFFEKKVFNTKERWTAYMKYDRSFSGTIVHSFPGGGKFSYKYADYTMEDGTLSSYEFNGEERYYSDEKIPLYSSIGLITSYWSLEKNKNIGIGGDWNDKYCEINFGIPKSGLECSTIKRKYRKDLKNGLIK